MKAREIAVNILIQILQKGAYSNIVLNNELNKSRLEDKDRALVTEIVYGTIKYKYTIDHIISNFSGRSISKIDSFILNILRMSIYQIKYLDKIPDYAVVNEAVDLSKNISIGASKFVNGILRSYLRKKDLAFNFNDDEVLKLSYEYSFEPWMVKMFMEQYGAEITKSILKGLNYTPNMSIRVNSYKGTYEDTFNKLEELGYEINEGFICPEAISINKGSSIENNPVFKSGYITVQDESAMLVAPILDADENHTVFDLCSAPGGKTTHISELMNNKGKVVAFDIHENKLSLIKQNAERLGLSNIEYRTMDATQFNESLVNKADRVLIDVPCSGIGIIRKKPEIKWNKINKDMKALSVIQRNIMENAGCYLKEGGILIYSTCTLNKYENEKNIQWFIKKHPNFKVENVYLGKSNNIIYHDEGYITIIPNEYMDGFFIAKLIKCW